jgi:hypothetical protein
MGWCRVRGVDQVTRIRREQTGTDRYGNPVYGVVETVIPELAFFAPKDVIPSLEVGRSPVVVEPTLYWFQVWPDVSASDRVRVRGVEYEVESVPAEWRGATVGGLVVKLRDSTEGVP